MGLYRKKPVVVEAVQWFPGLEIEGVIGNWENNPMTPGKHSVQTLEGWLNVSAGDWIITGVKGEKYPCKPDVFEMTYEAVESAPS